MGSEIDDIIQENTDTLRQHMTYGDMRAPSNSNPTLPVDRAQNDNKLGFDLRNDSSNGRTQANSTRVLGMTIEDLDDEEMEYVVRDEIDRLHQNLDNYVQNNQ